MLKQEENPGIEFEYSLPSGSIQETPQGGEGYDWTEGISKKNNQTFFSKWVLENNSFFSFFHKVPGQNVQPLVEVVHKLDLWCVNYNQL